MSVKVLVAFFLLFSDHAFVVLATSGGPAGHKISSQHIGYRTSQDKQNNNWRIHQEHQ